jgi:hypothetical protein
MELEVNERPRSIAKLDPWFRCERRPDPFFTQTIACWYNLAHLRILCKQIDDTGVKLFLKVVRTCDGISQALVLGRHHQARPDRSLHDFCRPQTDEGNQAGWMAACGDMDHPLGDNKVVTLDGAFQWQNQNWLLFGDGIQQHCQVGALDGLPYRFDLKGM